MLGLESCERLGGTRIFRLQAHENAVLQGMVAQVGIGKEILDRPLDDIQIRSVSPIHHRNLALQYGENAPQIGVIFMEPPQYLRHADILP